MVPMGSWQHLKENNVPLYNSKIMAKSAGHKVSAILFKGLFACILSLISLVFIVFLFIVHF